MKEKNILEIDAATSSATRWFNFLIILAAVLAALYGAILCGAVISCCSLRHTAEKEHTRTTVAYVWSDGKCIDTLRDVEEFYMSESCTSIKLKDGRTVHLPGNMNCTTKEE